MRLKNTITYLSTFLINSILVNAQTTINLSPECDAAISYHDYHTTSSNNFGSAIQNAAYSIPGTSGGLKGNRALIKFDLSSIPVGSSISSAKLNLYALGPLETLSGHTGENNGAVLQRVIENWNENIVSWDSQPATTNQNETTLLPSTNPLQDYLDIDVTSLIQDMLNSNNYGFLLKLIDENATNALLFASINSGDPTKYPLLEITYNNCLTLNSNFDAAIGYHDYHNTSGNNYGTAIQNAAYSLPGNYGGLNENRALIKFDLSSIPVGSSISSAKLNLYALGPLGQLTGHTGENNGAVLQRVTKYWNDNSVSWDSQPSTTTQNEKILLPSTDPLQNYLDIEVTSLIQDMVNNDNYGFLLKLVSEDPTNALLFASSDHSDTKKHPKLNVCYSTATTNINEVSIKTVDFNLYPNPSKGLITIELNSFNPNKKVTINVYSITGKLITSRPMKQLKTEINLEGADTGIYFIKLLISNQVITKKVILSN